MVARFRQLQIVSSLNAYPKIDALALGWHWFLAFLAQFLIPILGCQNYFFARQKAFHNLLQKVVFGSFQKIAFAFDEMNRSFQIAIGR